MKLITTNDYLLLIDEEADIQINNYFLVDETIEQCLSSSEADDLSIGEKYPKIIAYYPLSKKAKELDLPLLPNPFRDVVDINIQTRNFNKQVKNPYLTEEKEYQVWERAYIEGFNDGIVQPKQFSLEDMIGFAKFYIIKHVIPYELDVISGKITDEQKIQMLQSDIDYNWNKLAQEYIQSLSTQQLPKEFILGEGGTIEEQIKNGYYE